MDTAVGGTDVHDDTIDNGTIDTGNGAITGTDVGVDTGVGCDRDDALRVTEAHILATT